VFDKGGFGNQDRSKFSLLIDAIENKEEEPLVVMVPSISDHATSKQKRIDDDLSALSAAACQPSSPNRLLRISWK
jgi:hypothetical protein